MDDARGRGILTVYVNDNFDDWTLDRSSLLERVTDGPHRRLVDPLAPREDVALVLKGRHSSSASSTPRSTPTSASLR